MVHEFQYCSHLRLQVNPNCDDLEYQTMRVVSLIDVDLHSVENVSLLSEAHPEYVEQMNLHGNHLKTLDGIEQFQRISELCASNNCIEVR